MRFRNFKRFDEKIILENKKEQADAIRLFLHKI